MSPSLEWMWGSDWSDDDVEDDQSVGSSKYSMDADFYPCKREVEVVETSYGPVSVTILGERGLKGLVTYHDVGLNHASCFQGLLLCPDTASLLFHNFCIYNIDAPGHEVDADEIDPRDRLLTADDLAMQVAEVVQHFELRKVVCLGVTAGAYLLSLFAASHPDLVDGLVLVSPTCKAPSWTEWALNKTIGNILCFYGVSRFVKDSLLHRYFCQEIRGFQGPGSDAVISFRRELEEREPENVMRYIHAMQHRRSLLPRMQQLQCEVLIVVGQMSPYREESLELLESLGNKKATWVEIEACGSLVTEERPHTMQAPLEHFLAKLGLERPSPMTFWEFCSPVSTPNCIPISPLEMTPEALGVKLKPIKIKVEVDSDSDDDEY